MRTLTITFALIGILFVWITVVQMNDTIVQQQNLIREMEKNPSCMAAPAPTHDKSVPAVIDGKEY